MVVALCSAVGVLLWQRWNWFAFLAYVASAPQLAAWLGGEYQRHLATALVVTAAFATLFVVAALGYEVRVPTAKLRISSASLLFLNASLTSFAGWVMLHGQGHGDGATAWVIAVAAAHAGLGIAARQSTVSREVAALLLAVGAALAAIGLSLALDGPALVASWCAEAVLMAWAARRLDDDRGHLAAYGLLALAAANAFTTELQPDGLAYGVDSVPRTLVTGAILVAGALLVDARALGRIAAAFAVYVLSLLVVDAAGGRDGKVEQDAQLALSAFWAALGFASLLAGLARDLRPLRLAGLALLLVAIGKVFVVDLASLESAYRVLSFLALGLLLLAGAFAYQRMRKEPPS